MKSFIKTIVTPTLFALSASAWAIGPSECPRILVTNDDISISSHQALQEAVKSFPPHSDLLQFGDFFLLRDTMGFNRRIRYLQAVKVLDFRRIAEESIRELDLNKTKPPFFFSLNGETFYLVTADQLKDIQNVTETFIKSIAGLSLPDLPQVPVQPQAALLGAQVQARQPAKVPKLTQIEWTTKKKSEKYFAPQASRLSTSKPLLISTWWNRPGWAAVDAEYLRDNGPSRVRDLIRSETQVTFTDSVYGSLTKYLANPLNQSVLPSNKLSTQGMGRMNEALIQQSIFVAEEPTSGHRLIILPLMVQDTPAKAGQASKVIHLPPVKTASIPKPTPPPVQLSVQRAQSPLNRGPKRAPLVPVNDWVSDIYAPEAPPISRVHYNFLPSLAPERFIADLDEFERQLDLNVPLALPSKLRSGLFEFPFYWIEHHEMKVARVTFSFTRYQNGEVMVTISDFSLMDDFAEKKFYQTFADFHHIEDKVYVLSNPVKVGPISSDRINIHRKIRSKLLLKHDLSFDEQDIILAAIKSVSKNGRGYRAKVGYEGDVYSIYVDIESDGSIVVKSGYVDQRD